MSNPVAGTERSIKVDYLARVEGEGALELQIKDGALSEVYFRIFEPPRFFEAFLCGRRFDEAPDITARICGICPVAYQMSSSTAMEDALGVTVDGPLRDLRRLLYLGEWIESHALHVYLLHAPDFLGYQDGIQMAEKFPNEVRDALRLKKIGNALMDAVGGRAVHPVNVKVGGWWRAPDEDELTKLLPDLRWALEFAKATVALTASLDFPDFERDYDFVALTHPDEYAITDGRIISSKGLDIAVDEYLDHFEEEHVAHSNALHSRKKGEGDGVATSTVGNYMVGPLARFNLNYDKLTPQAKASAASVGLAPGCKNPFKSIIARSVELVFSAEESIRIIEAYKTPDESSVKVVPTGKTAEGCGFTEAPRGGLFHRYRLDGDGLITDARIVPPTSQNQKCIEQDLWEFVPPRLEMEDDELTLRCEQAIRNYDPCISCATHSIKVTVDRS